MAATAPSARPLWGLLAALACATPVGAQVTARAEVRVGPTQPAPPGSLATAPVSPLLYRQGPDGVVVIELETHGVTGDWVEERDAPGFSGASYFRWGGPNQFAHANRGRLAFPFELSRAGRYIVRVHARHDDPDPGEGNDVWMRLAGDPWERLFQHGGSAGVGVWTFNTWLASTRMFPDYDLAAGIHTLEFAGRSADFRLDRVEVIPFHVWFPELARTETVVRQRPLIGESVELVVGDPTGVAGFTPGLATTLLYLGEAHPNTPTGDLTPWGELLLASVPTPFPVGPAVVWNGPASPAVHLGAVPDEGALLGLGFVLQGLILQPGRVVLTDALDLVVGDR